MLAGSYFRSSSLVVVSLRTSTSITMSIPIFMSDLQIIESYYIRLLHTPKHTGLLNVYIAPNAHSTRTDTD